MRNLFALAALTLAHAAVAGPLTPPPGPPTSTLRTLDQVEPRTEINTLPGILGTLHAIDQPGSYYLTGDIVTIPPIIIRITASNAVIDLNGFALDGNGTAPTAIRVAIPAGVVTVRNGTIRNTTGLAIQLDNPFSTRVILDNVVVTDCGSGGSATRCTIINSGGGLGPAIKGESDTVVRDTTIDGVEGIALGNRALVERVRVFGVTTAGITVGDDALVADAVVVGADLVGIEAGDRSIVRGSRVRSITGDGIRMGDGARVLNSIVAQVTAEGFELGDAARVEGCRADDCAVRGFQIGNQSIMSTSTATNNDFDGILTGSASVVDQCIAQFNGTNGIRVGSNTIVIKSIATQNDRDGIEGSTNVLVALSSASANGLNGITL